MLAECMNMINFLRMLHAVFGFVSFGTGDGYRLVCEQALHLGDIVKSTRASGTRREMRPLARLALLCQIGELAHRLSSVDRAQAGKREN